MNDEIKNPDNRRRFRLEHWQRIAILLAFYDIAAILISFYVALCLRFDGKYSYIPRNFMSAYLKFMPIYIPFCIIVFYFLRLYRSIWRFASYSELMRVILANAVTFVFHSFGITYFYGKMPLSYYVWGSGLQFILTVMIRFSYRFVLLEKNRPRKVSGKQSRVMLIGAGAAGQMILRDIHKAHEINAKVCCIIDDNSNKWGRYIDGVPVVGGRDDILANVKKYDIQKIFYAIPSSSAEQKRDILNICSETNCELMSLPGMYQLVNGEVSVSSMRRYPWRTFWGGIP